MRRELEQKHTSNAGEICLIFNNISQLSVAHFQNEHVLRRKKKDIPAILTKVRLNRLGGQTISSECGFHLANL
jgi:hypothetical protein